MNLEIELILSPFFLSKNQVPTTTSMKVTRYLYMILAVVSATALANSASNASLVDEVTDDIVVIEVPDDVVAVVVPDAVIRR